MDWLSVVSKIIENLYYISGIILVAGVILGLKQLNLVKEQIKLVKDQLVLVKDEADLVKKDFLIRNKRASIEKSIEYLNWFAIEFIPQVNEYKGKLLGKDIKEYPHIKGKTFTFDDIVSGSDDKVVFSVNCKAGIGALDLMNQLEFFSAAMTSGLADEELAFNPLAIVFCQFIEYNYDVYCDIRNGGQDTMFTKSIELYEMWKERLESLELEKKQKEIDEQKSKMQNKTIKHLGNE